MSEKYILVIKDVSQSYAGELEDLLEKWLKDADRPFLVINGGVAQLLKVDTEQSANDLLERTEA